MGPQSIFQSLLFIHSHTHTHSYTTLEELHFISCTYFSPCRGAFKWMWCRCAFSPPSTFPFIKNGSTVALDSSLTPIELRECSSSVPGVWLWYLPPANDSGTVSKNDYDVIKSKTKWATHTRTNHLNSWFNPFFFLMWVLDFFLRCILLKSWWKETSQADDLYSQSRWSLLPAAWHLALCATRMQAAAAVFHCTICWMWQISALMCSASVIRNAPTNVTQYNAASFKENGLCTPKHHLHLFQKCHRVQLML